MKMDIKVRPIDKGNLKAYADITFNDMITIKGFALTQYEKNGETRFNINMPARKLKEPEVNEKSGELVEYKELCFPTSAEFRKELLAAVVNTYSPNKATSKSFGTSEEFMKVNLHLIKNNNADTKAKAMCGLEFNEGKDCTHFVVDRLVIRENKNGKAFVAVPQQAYTDRNGEKQYSDRYELTDDAKGIIVGSYNKLIEKSLDRVLNKAKAKAGNLQSNESKNTKGVEQDFTLTPEDLPF